MFVIIVISAAAAAETMTITIERYDCITQANWQTRVNFLVQELDLTKYTDTFLLVNALGKIQPSTDESMHVSVGACLLYCAVDCSSHFELLR